MGWTGTPTSGEFFIETPGNKTVSVKNGNMTVPGSVTATGFVGDGSKLEKLPQTTETDPTIPANLKDGVTVGEVSGLQDSLAAKSPTSHNHSAADLTSGVLDAARIGNNSISPAKLSVGGATAGQVLTVDGTSAVWKSPESGGGVSSVTGTSPISVTPTTGATVVSITNGGIDSTKLASNSVSAGKIATGAVTDAKISGTISGSKIGTGINAANITTGTVGVANLPTGTTSSTVSLGNHSHTGTGTITSVTGSNGLTGSGTSGAVTLSANLTTSGGENGTATTVARGDHGHDSKYTTQAQVDNLVSGKMDKSGGDFSDGITVFPSRKSALTICANGTNEDYPKINFQWPNSSSSQILFNGLPNATCTSPFTTFEFANNWGNNRSKYAKIHINGIGTNDWPWLELCHDGTNGKVFSNKGDLLLEVPSGQAVRVNNDIVQTSDRRLKENIKQLNVSSSMLDSISPITFNYIQDTNRILPKGEQIGVIAQDVEKVFSTDCPYR